jgi:hypothetical protein
MIEFRREGDQFAFAVMKYVLNYIPWHRITFQANAMKTKKTPPSFKAVTGRPAYRARIGTDGTRWQTAHLVG